jgi:hypothetical protein
VYFARQSARYEIAYENAASSSSTIKSLPDGSQEDSEDAETFVDAMKKEGEEG